MRFWPSCVVKKCQNALQFDQPGPNHAHTFPTVLAFTSLPGDPEVGGTTVHHDGKIARRGSNLDCGKVIGIGRTATPYQLGNLPTRREVK